MQKKRFVIRRPLEIAAHILFWLFIIGSQFMLHDRTEGFELREILRGICIPGVLCIAFYANYLWLSRWYITKRIKLSYFLISNLILLGACTACASVTMEFLKPTQEENKRIEQFEKSFDKTPPDAPTISGPSQKQVPMVGKMPQDNRNGFDGKFKSHHHHRPSRILFMLNDIIMIVLAAGMGSTLRMSKRWWHAEQERREAVIAQKQAELALKDSELSNLRNQINPHFLLNTLNNIYALITFDSDKAQKAIIELSKLLRYILYENNGRFIGIDKELNFLRNYIELMRLRLPKNFDVQFVCDISKTSGLQVAPLLYISLIENAFKHGISPTEDGFIHIHFDANEQNGEIICDIKNSNYPKTRNDKSGNGIGLEQVQRRLDILYPQRYVWTKTIEDDNKTYHSYLLIKSETI